MINPRKTFKNVKELKGIKFISAHEFYHMRSLNSYQTLRYYGSLFPFTKRAMLSDGWYKDDVIHMNLLINIRENNQPKWYPWISKQLTKQEISQLCFCGPEPWLLSERLVKNYICGKKTAFTKIPSSLFY